MRKTYVYALDIELPEEPTEPDHDPDFCDCHHSNGDVRWPKNRKFLSSTAAWHRAHLFERLGAKVNVIRSESVIFPSVATMRQEVTQKTIEGLRAIEQDLR